MWLFWNYLYVLNDVVLDFYGIMNLWYFGHSFTVYCRHHLVVIKGRTESVIQITVLPLDAEGGFWSELSGSLAKWVAHRGGE